MTTWGDRLGADARPTVGVGQSIAPDDVPQLQDIIHTQWKLGLDVSDAAEDVPTGTAQAMVDIEVDRSDSLIRAPGVVLNEDVDPRSLRYLFEHAAVDFSTELVVFDPPYLGYKGAGNFIFVNLGLAVTGDIGWNIANVAGTLIFSNGISATYTRDPGAAVVTDISAEIVAQTFATSFGRTFAGAFTDPITGLQGLGLRWNASNGFVDDWSGLGSGGELLLSNQPEADRIIALRAIGFDLLGILCRKTLWIGYQTGNDDRPVDPRPRFPGLGCVAEPTAVSTPQGIVFLSDEGVVLFNSNEAKIISGSINPLLLPLNYLLLSQYRASYMPVRQRYELITPSGTWIYEFAIPDSPDSPGRPARWFFSSLIADSVVIFTHQNSNLYWDTVQGTWDDQTLTWNEMVISELNSPPNIFFGIGTKLTESDYGATDYLGVAQDPYWTTPQKLVKITNQVGTHELEVEYSSSEDATLSFSVPNVDGNYTATVTRTFPNTNGVRMVALIPCFAEGLIGVGALVRVHYDSGSCSIFRIRQAVTDAGPTMVLTL